MRSMPPGDGADELAWLTFEQAGVLTTAQARGTLSEGRVRGNIRSGRWRAICRGILLTGNGQLTRDQQLWVAVLVAGPGAVLAGATAAAEAGVRGLPRETVQVLVPAHRRPGRELLRRLPLETPAVRVRRTTVLPETHLQAARPNRTTTARSLVDAAGWARDARTATALLAAGCQQRRVTPDELDAVLAELPGAPRRELIRHTLADLTGGAEALSEIDFVRLCRRYGLPPPETQHRRTDVGGRTRWLDGYWPCWRLHVEIDGSHHMDVRHWAADMQRQNDVWTAGDRILRFPAWLVRTRPDEVARTLRRALVAAGWSPT
ncbi:hypothetical protein AWW66_25425 [Micromonospora rosaria]|uniref:DUF559 domain-containing protein n=1 Tax=Micromonospora rosaria TaxID=47874 RepID=A0A136PLL3_9ACTN|nr:hypothetical protein [Micromonospora rosaria]KXK59216.1 hypothetical protein AWW66_25425 [Micromonospora rosaria]